MGSFKGTCAISQLIVDYDAPVRFLLIQENPGFQVKKNKKNPDRAFQQGLDTHDFWVPKVCPVKGIYNGYSGVDLESLTDEEDRLNFSTWLEYLRPDIIPLPKPTALWDAIDPLTMDQKSFLTAIDAGRLMVNEPEFQGHGHIRCGVCSIMVREDIWQLVLNLAKEHFGEYSTVDCMEQAVRDLKRNVEGCIRSKHLFEMAKAYEGNPSEDSELNSVMAEIYSEFEEKEGPESYSLFGWRGQFDGLVRNYPNFTIHSLAPMVTVHEPDFEHLTKEDIEAGKGNSTYEYPPHVLKLLQEVAEFEVIKSLMSILGLTWHPQTGATQEFFPARYLFQERVGEIALQERQTIQQKQEDEDQRSIQL